MESLSRYLLHSEATADVITALDVVHIGGIVLKDGHVVTNAAQGVYPFHCSATDGRRADNCTEINAAVYVESVFVVAEDPTGNFYHFSIEQLLRLAAYVDLLRARPDITLHVGKFGTNFTQRYLEIFGLRNSVVTGPVRAGLILVPHGGGCHHPNLASVQLAQSLYHNHIITNLLRHQRFHDPAKPTIVLLKRKSRPLTNHDDVLLLLKHLSARGTGCDVIVFDDAALPSFADTMRLFYRARVIIGPHGAGFANIVFAQSGSVVIEVLCMSKIRPSIRLLARNLGIRYIGTMTSQELIKSARCVREGVTANMVDLKRLLHVIFTKILLEHAD